MFPPFHPPPPKKKKRKEKKEVDTYVDISKVGSKVGAKGKTA